MQPFKPKIFSTFERLTAFQTHRNTSVNEQLLLNGINEQQCATSKQIHDNKILPAEKAGRYEGYDAIITNEKNLFVGVNIADCTPILIYDPTTHAVAAIHAGWRGTVKNIAALTLQKMKSEFGTEGKNCFAYVGACISSAAFEVGPEVAEHFHPDFVTWNAEKQKHHVDLKKANLYQLKQFGIPEVQIEISEYCTVQHNDLFYSYRKENGTPGRMLALIGVRDY